MLPAFGCVDILLSKRSITHKPKTPIGRLKKSVSRKVHRNKINQGVGKI